MTFIRPWAAALLCFFFVGLAQAQVPGLLNYQGRVAVGSVNFNGTGQFKFALVNANGSTTYWSNDGTSAAGSQPTAAVPLPVTKGLYSVLLGDTTLANMTTVPASVFTNSDVRLRVWFNDGTNGFQLLTPDQRIAAVGYAMTAGSVPAGAITSSMLAPGAVGGTQLAAGAAAANLSASGLGAIPSGGIVASNDPASAALTAQGFVRDPASTTLGESWTTMPSGDAVAGHTTVWTGTELLIWGGVVPAPAVGAMPAASAAINRGLRYNPTTGAWASISTTGAPQARFYHTAVWTGTQMIVWGGQTSFSGSGANVTFPTVLSTGGIYTPATDTWTPMASNGTVPMADARSRALAFWTGTDLLIWGGSSTTTNLGSPAMGGMPGLQGARYNLATNTWSTMAANLPEMSVGSNWSGVWTGSAMIVWSNQVVGDTSLPAAGMYNPTSDSWQTLPRVPGDPAIPSTGFSTVWTGTEMILWGGYDGGTNSYSNVCYRFNPTTTSWATAATSGAPDARTEHYAVNLGGKMVIWGGKSIAPPPGSAATIFYRDGGIYDPVANTWQSITATDAPPYRTEATVTAASDRIFVWAGIQTPDSGNTTRFLKHGGSFLPSSGTWTSLANGSPAPRFGHSAVWTGTELIVWGGSAGSGSGGGGGNMDFTFNDGARYNPATGVWTPLPTTNAPSGRYGHSAVWTGTEMVVWGGQYIDYTNGFATTATLNTGARYNPQTNTWTPTTTASAPSARTQHGAVWAGNSVNQMIILGGSMGMGGQFSDGARYSPSTDSWSSISATDAPSFASGISIPQWSGTEVVVFDAAFSNGGRYNPVTDTWRTAALSPILYNGTPFQTQTWTGSKLLVFVPGSGSSTGSVYFYDPTADYWQQSAATGGPVGSLLTSSSVWTGTSLILWGSNFAPSNPYLSGSYSADTDSWSSLTTLGAPAVVYGIGLWTGTEMQMWGGITNIFIPGGGIASDKGTSYRPARPYYFYRRP